MDESRAVVHKVVSYINVERRFGFTKDSVFFHLDQEVIPICDGSDEPYLQTSKEGSLEKDDEIVCTVAEGKKGKKVLWWAHKETWDDSLEAIKNRQTYRLVERTGRIRRSRLSSPLDATYRVLWEGRNIEELRKRFPMRQYHLHNQDLRGLYFEVLTDGSWITVDGDPRDYKFNQPKEQEKEPELTPATGDVVLFGRVIRHQPA